MLKKFSIVIPTYNSSNYIFDNWKSLLDSNLFFIANEVIYINDGSTDDSEYILKELYNEYPNKLRIINLYKNEGRYSARLHGARNAFGPFILFMDIRVNVDLNFTNEFSKLIQLHNCLTSNILIDIQKNIYNLYWQRVHEFIFKNHYALSKKICFINSSNYSKFLTGTTLLYVSKNIYIRACDNIHYKNPLHDDGVLIENIVNITPMLLSPNLNISWSPRNNLSDFITRIWERGPSFAELHLFKRKDKFFYLILFYTICMLYFLIYLSANLYFKIISWNLKKWKNLKKCKNLRNPKRMKI
jgi:glycosyltransferase involved in cell wall biosynthesis